MLQDVDLKHFVELARRVEVGTGTHSGARPDFRLRADRDASGLLHRNQLGRLARSLKIAHVAGDIPEAPHLLLHAIIGDLKDDGLCYRPLTDTEEWQDALRWAAAQPDALNPEYRLHQGRDREFVVGMACRDLRRRGYEVDVGGNGPRIDSTSRAAVARKVNALIAQVGGIEAICWLCEIIHRNHRVHDGMWLLGNLPSRPHEPAVPWVPIGWLVSIALRHTERAPSADDPEGVWNAALRLASDFAASMDCQRYNQFDGLFLQATEFFPMLKESLAWRELFTLPQVPASVLPVLRGAFARIEWPEATADVAEKIDRFFDELDRLHAGLCVVRPTAMPRSVARSTFPLLWKHAGPPETGVNSGYMDPFGSGLRDQDRYVFFDGREQNVLVLPSPFAAAAACEAAFRLIWTEAGSAAGEIVGDTMEKCIAIGCGRHGGRMWEKEVYRAGGKRLEIDVAVRDGREIVLFETKAKSLRAVSRTGDMMAFIVDFTKSFLAALCPAARAVGARQLGRAQAPHVQYAGFLDGSCAGRSSITDRQPLASLSIPFGGGELR